MTARTPDLRQAYAAAREFNERRESLARRPGHRFIWTRADGGPPGDRIVFADPVWDTAVVVGRHTKCGIVFAEDPFVTLRHLLVRSIALPSGGVAMRLLDLHTSSGFVLADGSRQTSIFAEGPIAIAIGEHALIALPLESREARLPTELPPAQVHAHTSMRAQIAAMEQALSPYRVNARPNTSTRITLMPRLVMMGDPIAPRLSRLARAGRWWVSLERAGRRAMLTVSEDDLAGGVVIGRSEKCHAETLRRITHDSTSRVHVLILREEGEVYAYDLASTQGTFKDGVPVRRVALGRASTLTLGRGKNAVQLGWQCAE